NPRLSHFFRSKQSQIRASHIFFAPNNHKFAPLPFFSLQTITIPRHSNFFRSIHSQIRATPIFFAPNNRKSAPLTALPPFRSSTPTSKNSPISNFHALPSSSP